MLFGAGCANVLGIGASDTQVECTADTDCSPGDVCFKHSCTCTTDCAGGADSMLGPAGSAGVVTVPNGSGGASTSTGGSSSHRGGTGADETGGTGASGGAKGGKGGGAGAKPHSGGVTASGGVAGGDAGNGDTGGGTSGAGGGDDGGSAGEGPPPPPPLSCDGMSTQCAGKSCCASYELPGGDFLRSCDVSCSFCEDVPDHLYPADLSPFAMDAFEVTVGRFRGFVVHYAAAKPQASKGWDATWDGMLLGTSDELKAALVDDQGCTGVGLPTWTNTLDVNEALPINCVTWYEAQAFCLWDGGRLPTEAEWNFVAAGGDEERVYPWSDPPESSTIDETYAVYKWDEEPPLGALEVGSRGDIGRGKWGHYDLGGNVAEWLWDSFRVCYASPNECNDCGATLGEPSKVLRGGSFSTEYDRVTVDARREADGQSRTRSFGFRCVRDR